MDKLNHIKQLVKRITATIFGVEFRIIVSKDLKGGDRIFIQAEYDSPCTLTGEKQSWKGRKYYLSEYMTDDEVIKTCYVAFEQAVKHEVMEGFKVDNIILFNPHINYEELLKISHKEVKRNE